MLTVRWLVGSLWMWTSRQALANMVSRDKDMIHALRHHRRAFETDAPAVTMFVGLKFLKGWWNK